MKPVFIARQLGLPHEIITHSEAFFSLNLLSFAYCPNLHKIAIEVDEIKSIRFFYSANLKLQHRFPIMKLNSSHSQTLLYNLVRWYSLGTRQCSIQFKYLIYKIFAIYQYFIDFLMDSMLLNFIAKCTHHFYRVYVIFWYQSFCVLQNARDWWW